MLLKKILPLLLIFTMLVGNTIYSTSAAITTECVDGVISYWRLDERSGITAEDSADGNHGDVRHGESWVPGKINNGHEFFGYGLTILAWFRADDFGVNDGRIISKSTSVSTDDIWWMVSTRDPGDVGGSDIRMRFRLKTWPEGNTHTLVDNSGEGLTDNVGGYVNLLPDTWYFVAAVYDGSTMKIYVNGNLYASADVPKVAPFPNDERKVAASTADVWIGDNPTTAGSRPFDGIIDEVAVFSRGLSQSEITSFYNGGTGQAICSGGCPAGLVSYWPFNEGSGTTTADSKNGNDGTIQGGVSWTTGKIGNGLDFPGSGSDGYVDVGIVDVFPNFIDLGTFDVAGSDITILGWFKADDFGVNDARIISKATGTDTDDHFWMLSTRGVGGQGAAPYRMRFRVDLGGSTETLIDGSDPSSSSLTDTESTEIDLAINTWYFAAAVYDGSTMKIYLNDQLIANTAQAGTRETSTTAEVWMGDNPNTDFRPFDGIIDEVAVFNRALTQEEIEELYNGGVGLPICEYRNIVGGFVAPTNKLGILAPYLTFVGLVVAVTVMATALKKRSKA